MPTSSSMISDYQVPESMFQEQQHDNIPSQQGHLVKYSCVDKEGHRSAGGVKKSNKPEMVKGKTRIPEADKNIVGRSIADTADSNAVDQNKQASTMPGSGSYSLGGSDWRKQHVDGKISQNNSDGKKRERENDYSCTISMNCNQILEGDITSPDKQSSQNHVSSKINVQDKTKGMHTSDEDNIVKESIDSVVLEKSSCCSDPGIKIRDINIITYNDGGVDQIWALWDNIDRMSRSFMIKCVGHSKCLYWMKFYPLSEEEKEWNNKSLLVTCGKLRRKSQYIRIQFLVFSYC
ncbi:unnamed protein product [Miscanthus lutarioriparius]|uniref:DUF3444 domain-containing protein n=1 Tax=Miscanthus lutarioriparius TaxID=422564 RepID=A0A811QBX9_9POAL|nr:unnamed protein product [Miscanthus lutarioriparius]